MYFNILIIKTTIFVLQNGILINYNKNCIKNIKNNIKFPNVFFFFFFLILILISLKKKLKKNKNSYNFYFFLRSYFL